MHIERRSRTQRRPAVAIAARVLLRLLLAVLLVLTLGCIWASAAYDNISLEEVLFSLTMSLRGTAHQFIRELVKRVLIPSAVVNASPAEFIVLTEYCSPLRYVFSSFLLAAGTFLLWFNLFYYLAGKRAKRIMEAGICALSVFAVVDYMFFGTNSTSSFGM